MRSSIPVSLSSYANGLRFFSQAIARLTAAIIRPASGRYQSSSDLANGGGMNGAPTRTKGPSKLIESHVRKARDNFRADAERFDGFVTHDEAMSARQQFQDRRFVPRLQAAQVEDLGVDAFFFENARGGEADRHHSAIGDDGDVLARPRRSRPSDRHGGCRLGQLALGGVKRLVFDDDHRIVVSR